MGKRIHWMIIGWYNIMCYIFVIIGNKNIVIQMVDMIHQCNNCHIKIGNRQIIYQYSN